MNLFKKIKTFFSKPDNDKLFFKIHFCKDEKTLRKYSTHPDWRVRRQTARNEATSPETLHGMRNDKSVDVIKEIIENPNTPAETLVFLAGHPNPCVRWSICENEKTPAKALSLIASKDKRAHVILAIAKHKNADAKTLATLLPGAGHDVKEAIAKHKNADAETLALVARTRNSQIENAVALHPHTDAETLEELIEKGNWETQRYIALHPNASKETLEKLGVSKDRLVRKPAREQLERRQLNEKQGAKLLTFQN